MRENRGEKEARGKSRLKERLIHGDRVQEELPGTRGWEPQVMGESFCGAPRDQGLGPGAAGEGFMHHLQLPGTMGWGWDLWVMGESSPGASRSHGLGSRAVNPSPGAPRDHRLGLGSMGDW